MDEVHSSREMGRKEFVTGLVVGSIWRWLLDDELCAKACIRMAVQWAEPMA